ncbi:SufE family protein [Candidatus Chlamydia sanziniae]
MVIRKLFSEPFYKDALYLGLMGYNIESHSFDKQQIRKENLVLGCQSNLYLYEVYQEGRLFFFTYTEALISGGIASIFTEVYSGETPTTILTCKPVFFERLREYLSFGRVNGGESLYMKMKQISVRYLKDCS